MNIEGYRCRKEVLLSILFDKDFLENYSQKGEDFIISLNKLKDIRAIYDFGIQTSDWCVENSHILTINAVEDKIEEAEKAVFSLLKEFGINPSDVDEGEPSKGITNNDICQKVKEHNDTVKAILKDFYEMGIKDLAFKYFKEEDRTSNRISVRVFDNYSADWWVLEKAFRPEYRKEFLFEIYEIDREKMDIKDKRMKSAFQIRHKSEEKNIWTTSDDFDEDFDAQWLILTMLEYIATFRNESMLDDWHPDKAPIRFDSSSLYKKSPEKRLEVVDKRWLK